VTSRLRALSAEVRALEDRLRQGGGPEKVAKLHSQGKLSARERVTMLCDDNSRFLEIGLLVAYDQYEGQAPAAGVITERSGSAPQRAQWECVQNASSVRCCSTSAQRVIHGRMASAST